MDVDKEGKANEDYSAANLQNIYRQVRASASHNKLNQPIGVLLTNEEAIGRRDIDEIDLYSKQVPTFQYNANSNNLSLSDSLYHTIDTNHERLLSSNQFSYTDPGKLFREANFAPYGLQIESSAYGFIPQNPLHPDGNGRLPVVTPINEPIVFQQLKAQTDVIQFSMPSLLEMCNSTSPIYENLFTGLQKAKDFPTRFTEFGGLTTRLGQLRYACIMLYTFNPTVYNDPSFIADKHDSNEYLQYISNYIHFYDKAHTNSSTFPTMYHRVCGQLEPMFQYQNSVINDDVYAHIVQKLNILVRNNRFNRLDAYVTMLLLPNCYSNSIFFDGLKEIVHLLFHYALTPPIVVDLSDAVSLGLKQTFGPNHTITYRPNGKHIIKESTPLQLLNNDMIEMENVTSQMSPWKKKAPYKHTRAVDRDQFKKVMDQILKDTVKGHQRKKGEMHGELKEDIRLEMVKIEVKSKRGDVHDELLKLVGLDGEAAVDTAKFLDNHLKQSQEWRNELATSKINEDKYLQNLTNWYAEMYNNPNVKVLHDDQKFIPSVYKALSNGLPNIYKSYLGTFGNSETKDDVQFKVQSYFPTHLAPYFQEFFKHPTDRTLSIDDVDVIIRAHPAFKTSTEYSDMHVLDLFYHLDLMQKGFDKTQGTLIKQLYGNKVFEELYLEGNKMDEDNHNLVFDTDTAREAFYKYYTDRIQENVEFSSLSTQAEAMNEDNDDEEKFVMGDDLDDDLTARSKAYQALSAKLSGMEGGLDLLKELKNTLPEILKDVVADEIEALAKEQAENYYEQQLMRDEDGGEKLNDFGIDKTTPINDEKYLKYHVADALKSVQDDYNQLAEENEYMRDQQFNNDKEYTEQIQELQLLILQQENDFKKKLDTEIEQLSKEHEAQIKYFETDKKNYMDRLKAAESKMEDDKDEADEDIDQLKKLIEAQEGNIVNQIADYQRYIEEAHQTYKTELEKEKKALNVTFYKQLNDDFKETFLLQSDALKEVQQRNAENLKEQNQLFNSKQEKLIEEMRANAEKQIEQQMSQFKEIQVTNYKYMENNNQALMKQFQNLFEKLYNSNLYGPAFQQISQQLDNLTNTYQHLQTQNIQAIKEHTNIAQRYFHTQEVKRINELMLEFTHTPAFDLFQLIHRVLQLPDKDDNTVVFLNNIDFLTNGVYKDFMAGFFSLAYKIDYEDAKLLVKLFGSFKAEKEPIIDAKKDKQLALAYRRILYLTASASDQKEIEPDILENAAVQEKALSVSYGPADRFLSQFSEEQRKLEDAATALTQIYGYFYGTVSQLNSDAKLSYSDYIQLYAREMHLAENTALVRDRTFHYGFLRCAPILLPYMTDESQKRYVTQLNRNQMDPPRAHLYQNLFLDASQERYFYTETNALGRRTAKRFYNAAMQPPPVLNDPFQQSAIQNANYSMNHKRLKLEYNELD